jgi:hypothetical protein
MTSSRANEPRFKTRIWPIGGIALLAVAAGCNASTDDAPDTGTPMQPPSMTGTGGAPMTGGSAAPSMTGSGGMKAGSGGSGGMSAGSGGTGGGGSGGSGSTPPVDAGQPDTGAPDAGASGGPISYAEDLDALFIDAPCDAATPAPPANMATCQHPPNTQHIEKTVTFGGDADVTYSVTLRVRGVWEPTSIAGGQRPDTDNPLTIGGTVAVGSGDPINYQQYFIKVAKPAQTYWLNDYQYVAHDIHKEDYEATLQIAGGSSVVVTMNDGNDHQIANWTEDYFEGLEPYATMPSTGQLLRLDVVSVTAQ